MLIIDGHNLIPNIPGLSLSDMDDEESLAALLQQYARVKRKQVVVFFDGAPPGQAGERDYGTVRAYFVRAGRTADDAIQQYLAVIGKTARAATVVSSDRQVQANARERKARVLSSEDFARELSALPVGPASREAKPRGKGKPLPADPGGSPEQDVAQWADLFGLDPDHIDRPIPLGKKAARRPAGFKKQPAPPPDLKPSGAKKKPRPYHGFPKKP